MQQAVYLDNAATTPVDPRVVEAMLPYLRDSFGNPASVLVGDFLYSRAFQMMVDSGEMRVVAARHPVAGDCGMPRRARADRRDDGHLVGRATPAWAGMLLAQIGRLHHLPGRW